MAMTMRMRQPAKGERGASFTSGEVEEESGTGGGSGILREDFKFRISDLGNRN